MSISYGKMQASLADVSSSCCQLEVEMNRIKEKVSVLDSEMSSNIKRDEEERAKSNKKFDELYMSKNKTNEVITELTTTIKMMMKNFESQFENLDKKIDGLKIR